MMRHIFRIILLSLFLGLSSHGQQVRSISDKDGRKIEVIFYNKTDSGIHVIRTDGNDFIIDMNTLHPTAQKVVGAWKPTLPLRTVNKVRTDYAFACYNGKGVRKDWRRAFQVFEKSASNGDAIAQLMLGFMYLDGDGVSVNSVLGARWVERSARQGNMIAESIIGMLYIDGEGVGKSDTIAHMYLKRAADKGDASAQCNLGILYFSNDSVVHQDKEKGMDLFRKAAAGGHEGASKILARIANDQQNHRAATPSAGGSFVSAAYVSKIDRDEDDVIFMENGAVVKITWGFLGFVGFRKDAILFKDGKQWKIWIEGKKAFKCELLKAPDVRGRSAQLVHISEMLGNGTIIKMLDGSLFEVGSLYTIDTSLWLGISDGLLIDDSTLINFDEGAIVEVTRLK